MSELKNKITSVINDAVKNISIPTVSAQKQEFYKAGAVDLIRLIQVEIDKLN